MDRGRRRAAALCRAASRRAGRPAAAGAAAPAAAARSAARCPGSSRPSSLRSRRKARSPGSTIPADVTVSRQVLAEPDLDLASKTWARLADGTPLVTAEKRGKGWIVLVHTTANAEWSNLALSGLFVEMLRRIVAMSQGVTRQPASGAAADRNARRVRPAAARRRRRRGRSPAHEIATAIAVAAPPARLLRHRRRAARAQPVGRGHRAEADRDAARRGRARHASTRRAREIDLRPPLLTAAFLLALLDLVIAYALRGLLRRRAARGCAAVEPAGRDAAGRGRRRAPTTPLSCSATSELRLAYVRTGNREVDAVSRAGLIGLTATLNRRTAVETAEPLAVDIESDELIFFPLLYWPVTAEQAAPSPQRRRAHQPLSRNRRHDPVRHARRRRPRRPGPFGSAAASQRNGCAGWSAGSRCRRWCRCRPTMC